MDRYTVHLCLGHGTFGRVYEACDGQNVVAIKVPNEAMDGRDEINVLKYLHSHRAHPNIVSVLEYLDNGGLVLERAPFDLFALLESARSQGRMVPPPVAHAIILDIAEGLNHMHEANLMHLDVKPGNVLVFGDGTSKIADFGLACGMGTDFYNDVVVTLQYRAPELILGSQRYLYEVDLWSVGCILFELMTLRMLIPTSNVDECVALQLIYKHIEAFRGREVDDKLKNAVMLRVKTDLPTKVYIDLLYEIREPWAEWARGLLSPEASTRRQAFSHMLRCLRQGKVEVATREQVAEYLKLHAAPTKCGFGRKDGHDGHSSALVPCTLCKRPSCPQCANM